jgi:hypothetical protein
MNFLSHIARPSVRSFPSFFKRSTLLLATFPLRSCLAQNSNQFYGSVDTEQDLFQQEHRLCHGMENLPGQIVNEEWTELKVQEVLDSGDVPVG